MKKLYTMTQEQLDELTEICRSRPVIALNCGELRNPRIQAMAFWRRLADEHGFDVNTAGPAGSNQLEFLAVPKEPQ